MSSPANMVYLDNNATTRVDPRVVDAMLPMLTESYGNAASRTHELGRMAARAVDRAKEQVGGLICASRSADEIVFTSGATESDNLALKGVAHALAGRGKHIITQATEHRAVLDTCRRLEAEGFLVTYLPVDAKGVVSPDSVAAAIREDTLLVSVMLANNEIGTVQPIKRIGEVCRKRGVLFHCDAAQGVGVVEFDVQALSVDLASLSAHKMYGPKGIGALYVRRTRPPLRLVPEIDGGGHQDGIRSGTLATPLIVGFGVAAEIMRAEGAALATTLERLTARLRQRLCSSVPGCIVNGADGSNRHPGNLSISIPGANAEALMMAVPTVAISSGSACTTARVERSHVLRAIGLDDGLAECTLRFGMGRFSTPEHVDLAADLVAAEALRLQGLSRTATPIRRA